MIPKYIYLNIFHMIPKYFVFDYYILEATTVIAYCTCKTFFKKSKKEGRCPWKTRLYGLHGQSRKKYQNASKKRYVICETLQFPWPLLSIYNMGSVIFILLIARYSYKPQRTYPVYRSNSTFSIRYTLI